MEHEFIQTSNEYLQYLSDLGRFAVQNLEISARQEELIKDKLRKVILYIVTKRDSDSSLKTNKDVAKAEHDFLEIPLQIRNEYCNRVYYVLKEKTDQSVPVTDGLTTAMQYIFRKTQNTLWDSYISSVCIFIVENNLLPMASINSLNKIPFIPDMRITAEQLYEALKKMRYESKALGFIKSIPCPNAILDLLIENFKMNKKKKFIKAIHDNNCDLSSIQKICYINLKLEHLRFLYQQKIELSSEILLMEDPPQEEKGPCIILDEIQKYENKVLDPLFHALFGIDLKSIDTEKKEYKAYNMYSILRNHLSNEELEVTGIEKFCSKYLQRGATVTISPQKSNDENVPFQLPEKYFEQTTVPDQNAYFCKLKDCVKTGGGTKFMEFINWLAKEDKYIEDTPETKATLAFRLTGICPPQNPVEKIEWKAKATYLFYIIKNFYQKEDSKREKLEKFFSCKDDQFKNVASFSSYAKRGEKTTKDSFLLKIRELYPNIEK